MCIQVRGRVQGVYFRASTQEQAQALGVVGWVRNTPDGGVELEVEGAPAAVAELFAWCHRGPPHARVDSVQAVERGPLGSESGFVVRYS